MAPGGAVVAAGEKVDKHFEQECISMMKEIESITKEQDRVWNEISTVLDDSDDVALQVEMINDTKQHQLYNAKEKAAHLARAIAESSRVAKTSSRKVKEIDQLKARVNSTLELANGIAKQRTSLQGISHALNVADFEQAAEYISSYYKVEEQLQDIAKLEEASQSDSDAHSDEVKAETDSEDGQMVDVQRPGARATARLLQKKRDEVRVAVRAEFNAAARAQDRDGVLRFSKLFGKLGLEQEGREQYAQWLRQGCGYQLTSHVEESLAAIESGTGDTTHFSLVFAILDHVVHTIESEEEHVKQFFGDEGVASMIVALHQECTTHSVNVINTFLSDRKLLDPNKLPAAGGGGAAPMSPQKMDQTLDEISQLSHYCYLYFNFLTQRGIGAQPAAGDGAASKKTKKASTTRSQHSASEALRCSKLFDKLQELVACYLPLQRTYLNTAFAHALEASIEAAAKEAAAKEGGRPMNARAPSPSKETKNWMQNIHANVKGMDIPGAAGNLLGLNPEEDDGDTDAESALILVDDIFYVLLAAVKRVLHTKNGSIITNVVNIINDLIRDRLMQVILEKLQFRKDQVVPARTLSWMNAAQVSKLYCEKLSNDFMARCTKQLGEEEASDDKYAASAQELKSSAATFDEVLGNSMRKVTSVITKQLYDRGLIHFEQLSYVLGEEKLMHYEINDAWARAAVANWEQSLSTYEKLLNADNFNNLVLDIVAWMAKEIEHILMKKQLDLCGGLQLDKDIRTVKQYFSGKTEKPVREKFTRLTHIAALLIVDKLSEVEELWTGGTHSSGALMWRLSPAEAQKVLYLRKDLPRNAIKALALSTSH
ncbi:Conserved oligomeric Golgi complex subunit 4 [Diplonema papillatum]|nr:Conserved oligomeric Golgi complex subunit 4 [Diplonema papillatum]|eukprot:gene10174-15645_t